MTKNVYWITAAQPHRMAIVARPRRGDWLEDDIKRLSSEGIGVLVSMLTPEESSELGLLEEARLCDQCGISFFNLAIADRSVPNELEIGALLEPDTPGHNLHRNCLKPDAVEVQAPVPGSGHSQQDTTLAGDAALSAANGFTMLSVF
jgi:hypothetical protein